MSDKKEMTNKEFAEQNELFIKSCGKAGVTASKRQASKFRNKRGKAYNNK